MASSSFLSLLFVLFLLAAVCSARPGLHFYSCKTLFVSYTSAEEANNPSSSGEYFTVYRVQPFPIIINQPRPAAVTDHVQSDLSFDMSSLHERAKDILVLVAGLLFGIGCTSLAGAIMYILWLLFTDQYEICRSGYGENEEEENPKNMGYVMIADPVIAKEGYDGH
ncbi:hypothetical protein M5K25_009435 [Dendrobium thyrsiflorum]|uniref:Uncharacterized protein n=1 Tax=Dendrobium thyrsiflorum TaxID=117978 RepID=A0ABD0V5U3_DENTH